MKTTDKGVGIFKINHSTEEVLVVQYPKEPGKWTAKGKAKWQNILYAGNPGTISYARSVR